MAGRQLDPLRAVMVFDDQFAAVVFFRLGQKQCHRQIGADAQPGQLVAAHRIVDMQAEMLPVP